MKRIHKWFAAFLCLGLLAGCAASFDAGALVQGNLDLIYGNTYSEKYLESVRLTEEEADACYRQNLDREMARFAAYFDVALDLCDDTIAPQILELYGDIYGHAKYEVGETTQDEENYLVSVTIYPMDIISKVMEEDADSFLESWNARSASGEFAQMSEEEFETLWAQEVIDLVAAHVDAISYLAPETISVQVTQGEDGRYQIGQEDWTSIDADMIAYPD